MREKPKFNPESGKIPTPGGEVAEWRLWEVRLDSQGKEVGVYDPDRNFHRFGAGEHFVIERDRDSNTYQAVIVTPDGSRNILKTGRLQPEILEERGDMVEGLKVDLLRAIYEKCTKEYKGKYKSPLFGINVELERNEVQEIKNLLEQAKDVWKEFVEKEPLWEKFESALERRRKVHGTFMESKFIIQDSGISDVVEDLKDDKIPIIRVPSRIRNLYIWRSKIDGTEENLKLYESKVAKGTSATYLGENVKALYRFIKESSQNK